MVCMRVALTGHRPERLNGREKEVRVWIEVMLENFNDMEPITAAYCGMARGSDQIFGLECLKQGFPLYCCYPFKKDKYSEQEQCLMAAAEQTIFLREEYCGNAAYYERDCYMVDNCDVLFAIWDGEQTGGTWLTIDYALKQGKTVIYFPKELLWR